ncbi:RNA polymerase sigma factor [Deminuibacter soli]|uniref:RNA polymerase sigma-70 factor n=1 Tax=Deminuibacter soli TaxID=2291815 RepID=A0A3E1NIT5_9BACT|nr:sigma-70 family RNA polymerase sigma factor [Deminuibacter soli]RFM27832.1 hypothetical protein DXN05_14150 [Deminuibacter soli]
MKFKRQEGAAGGRVEKSEYVVEESLDRVLFSNIAAGDPVAFKALFDSYKRRIYAAAYKFTSSAEASEEIFQEVFVRIWVYRANLTEVQHPYSYIYRILSTVVYEHAKRNNKRQTIELLESIEADLAINDADDFVHGRDMKRLIQEAVERLSDQRKKVYELRFNQGMAYDEIAGLLKVSPSTVRNTFMEALKLIRKHVVRYSGEALVFSILLAFC